MFKKILFCLFFTPLSAFCRVDSSSTDSFFCKKNLPDLHKYKIFLAGETHALSPNLEIKYELFRYLYTNNNIKYFIFEYPHSAVWLIQEYFDTGDTTVLFDSMRYKEGRKFFRQLYSFYHSLPDSAKFFISGIDVEKYPSLSLKVLQKLVPAENIPEELKPIVKKINFLLDNIKEVERKDLKKFINYINRTEKKYPQLIRNVLGKNYSDFTKIISGMKLGLKSMDEELNYRSRDITYRGREKYMYKNIIEIFESDPEAKIFGQLGWRHVVRRKNLLEGAFLAYRLNNTKQPLLKDSVFSLKYIYKNNCACKAHQLPFEDLEEIEIFTFVPSQTDRVDYLMIIPQWRPME